MGGHVQPFRRDSAGWASPCHVERPLAVKAESGRRRGRQEAALRRYMKVDFEGNLRREPSHRVGRELVRSLGDDGQVGTEGDSPPIDQAAVAAQLRAVTVGLIRRLRSTASPGDLTWSQESALLRLETGGAQTISQLARAEGTRSQSMGAIVDSLAGP